VHGTTFAAFIMHPHECKFMAAVAAVHALRGAEKESTFTLENHDDRAERR
jgi:hypothetical protein